MRRPAQLWKKLEQQRHSSEGGNPVNVCSRRWKGRGESGEGLTELFPFLVSALEGPPTTREKVRVSMCLCKRNGIGAEQESTREGFLEEVANVPFPHLCLSSFRSECPSQRYVSLQCSRKKMLFLLTGPVGVGIRGREVGPLWGPWLARGPPGRGA